jgi:hypothetical protein
MNKCHRISWEGHGVGNSVGNCLLPFVFVFSVEKSSFILPNIETKHLWSRFPHEKLGVQQVIVLGS